MGGKRITEEIWRKKQKLHKDKQPLKLWQVGFIIIMASHFLNNPGVNNKETLVNKVLLQNYNKRFQNYNKLLLIHNKLILNHKMVLLQNYNKNI